MDWELCGQLRYAQSSAQMFAEDDQYGADNSLETLFDCEESGDKRNMSAVRGV